MDDLLNTPWTGVLPGRTRTHGPGADAAHAFPIAHTSNNHVHGFAGAASIDIVVGALDSEVCETMQHLLQCVARLHGCVHPGRRGCARPTSGRMTSHGSSRRWAHVAQVSYGATSPTLSDTSKFPTFVRTVPSDVRIVEGFADLVAARGVRGAAKLQRALSQTCGRLTVCAHENPARAKD